MDGENMWKCIPHLMHWHQTPRKGYSTIYMVQLEYLITYALVSISPERQE